MMRLVAALLLVFGLACSVTAQQVQPHRQMFTAAQPCDDSMIMAIEGGYEKPADMVAPATASILPAAQQPEAFRRIDAMNQLVIEAYPRPLGQEADRSRVLNQAAFAPGVTTAALTAEVRFPYYVCMHEGTGQVGFFGDNGTRVDISANDLSLLFSGRAAGDMQIDGRPVIELVRTVGSWKGYETYAYDETSNDRAIVLSRRGESPYTPVTREQYLTYQLEWVAKEFDGILDSLKLMPGNQADGLNRITKAREAAIKRHQDELALSRSQGLLDSPAFVEGPAVDETSPIFVPPGGRGYLLVTANPSYIRKDLPAYVPQFIVLKWTWDSGETSVVSGIQGVRFKTVFEADFPVEKLQAMIDE